MSTIKSRDRREPAISAGPETAADRERLRRCGLILVGHGSSRCAGPNELLDRQAAAIARRGFVAEAHALALHGARSPEAVLARLEAREALVLPLFMSPGQIVREKIPKVLGLNGAVTRVNGRTLHLCPPIGIHPKLTDLIAGQVMDHLTAAGFAAADTTVLLIGHGSKTTPASREAAELQASRVRATRRFRAVKTAFLEESPSLADVISGLREPVVAMGLFATTGRHSTSEIEEIIKHAASPKIAYLGAVGGHDGILDVIEWALADCMTGA